MKGRAPAAGSEARLAVVVGHDDDVPRQGRCDDLTPQLQAWFPPQPEQTVWGISQYLVPH